MAKSLIALGEKNKERFNVLFNALINSYSVIFFSKSRLFAVIIFAVTFIDFQAGMAGIISCFTAALTAYWLGLKKQYIVSGYYSFNSLLVGLGLGVVYGPAAGFYVFLVFASLLTLFLTVFFEGVIGKYGLPYLSVPFLTGIWLVTLAAREFNTLEMSHQGLFVINELYFVGGQPLIQIYNWFNQLNIPDVLTIYFKSLGAVFFQYQVFAGMVIATGLLLWSRIAFMLSLFGFFSAYLFYSIIGVRITDIEYSFIGFNFILTSIAIGGFFLLPRISSFFAVFMLTPLVSIVLLASNVILRQYNLSVLSLPFNFIVLIFIYSLKFREKIRQTPELTIFQHYSPETNLYTQINNRQRFSGYKYYPAGLPFWGEWVVTQGHNGKHTHLDSWQHAWDFEIFDEEGKTYKNEGKNCDDYYCYNKPVIAPLNGWIEELTDGIEDNAIGDVNVLYNWGNTIVIKHDEGLYSQLSHLKSGSIKVQKGQFVKKGEIVAACGNSGRSPYPHLHFQFQSTPFIGSKTIFYPFTAYIQHAESGYRYCQSEIPQIHQRVTNITLNKTISEALHFIPGQSIKGRFDDLNNLTTEFEWEVKTDIFNNSYIYCPKSKTSLYFWNNAVVHHFSGYSGNQNTALFFLYLSLYKVIPGAYEKLTITDHFPVNIFANRFLLLIQDFIAPFYIFLKPEYAVTYSRITENLSGGTIMLSSKATIKVFRKIIRKLEFQVVFENQKVSIDISEKKSKKRIELYFKP